MNHTRGFALSMHADINSAGENSHFLEAGEEPGGSSTRQAASQEQPTSKDGRQARPPASTQRPTKIRQAVKEDRPPSWPHTPNTYHSTAHSTHKTSRQERIQERSLREDTTPYTRPYTTTQHTAHKTSQNSSQEHLGKRILWNW